MALEPGAGGELVELCTGVGLAGRSAWLQLEREKRDKSKVEQLQLKISS
jgi:hypothetical protein